LLLTEDYRHNRDALRLQKQEIEQASQRVQEQLRELQNERALLAEWIAGEQTRLHAAEQELSQQRAIQNEREQTWRLRFEALLARQAERDEELCSLRRQLTDRNRAAAAE
jgi:septal ring factor EnvC (AmiA/AmiB activator)